MRLNCQNELSEALTELPAGSDNYRRLGAAARPSGVAMDTGLAVCGSHFSPG